MSIMELRHLRYFLAIAQELNFTRAAERLGIGQPPLSQQIKDLEQEVGTLLFQRTPRGVVLTEAGQAFMTEAELVVLGAERAKAAAQRAARGETGLLRVGFTSSAAFNSVVPQAIRNYRRTYPHVTLTLEEANTARQLQWLEDGLLDVAFIRPGPLTPAHVYLHRYVDESMKIVLPTSHSQAQANRLPIAALAEDSFILFPRRVGQSLYDEIVNACRQAGFEPIRGQEAPQLSSVINLVAAELGVSIVPAAITQVQIPGVHYLEIEGNAPKARLALAIRAEEQSAVVRNFVGLAVER